MNLRRIVYGLVIALLALSACAINRGREMPLEHNQDDIHHTILQANTPASDMTRLPRGA